MPPQTSNFYVLLFYVTFWVIYLTNVFIINPKLDVWYFICSTTLISAKLVATFRMANRQEAGYHQKKGKKEVEYVDDILLNINQTKICPKCKVVRSK